jgi:hypothetical protein
LNRKTPDLDGSPFGGVIDRQVMMHRAAPRNS